MLLDIVKMEGHAKKPVRRSAKNVDRRPFFAIAGLLPKRESAVVGLRFSGSLGSVKNRQNFSCALAGLGDLKPLSVEEKTNRGQVPGYSPCLDDGELSNSRRGA